MIAILKKSRHYVIFFIIYFITLTCFAAVNWQKLANGVSYTVITNPHSFYSSQIYAFKIDPQQFKFILAKPNWLLPWFYSLKDVAQKNHAILAINGGFFEPNFNPLGLRISNGNLLNSAKTISWWHVFAISKNNLLMIQPIKYFNPKQQIDFAIQAGPRLLNQNKITTLKKGVANRSALGITRDKQVIIVATEHWPMDLTSLAKIMRDQLGCIDAINLDGGSSTQLYAQIDQFQLKVLSFAPVADVILVIRK